MQDDAHPVAGHASSRDTPGRVGLELAGEGALKLTTYFGERDRTESGRLLGDELLDLYAAHRMRASVLMRGAAGFGRLRHLRTDRLLTLSEDLPVVSLAVDRRERIEAMLERVMQIKRRGLVTLERARLLEGEPGAMRLPIELGGTIKLTIYVGRRERVRRTPAFVAVTELLHRHGIAGATVLLGVDGVRCGRRTRATFFARNGEVPMMIVAVGAGERIAGLLPEISAQLARPLLTLERVRVCKRDGRLLAAPHELPGTDVHGLALWQKLMIYTSQGATHEGHPLNVQIIRRLRESDAAGATSIRGVWGFHGDHAPHGDRLLQLRRHVPVVTIAIDSPERIGRSFQIVDELTSEHGLVTSEMVPAMAAIGDAESRGGLRLADYRF
jgi:PII-like signaling protein